MAIITKQWCAWDNDLGTVSYQYDDTVAAGFPFGKLTALSWANGSSLRQIVTITLMPGNTASDLAPGAHNSIPLAVGALTPTTNGSVVQAGDVAGLLTTFAARAAAAVGATSILVTNQTTTQDIPAGSQVLVPLPSVTIPPAGQTAALPAAYGGGTIGSTGSANVTSFGIPMVQITSHGLLFVAIPALLNCAG